MATVKYNGKAYGYAVLVQRSARLEFEAAVADALTHFPETSTPNVSFAVGDGYVALITGRELRSSAPSEGKEQR